MMASPLLWSALTGASIAAVLVVPTGAALSALEAARVERANAQATTRAPTATVPLVEGAMAAASRDAANAALIRRVRALAGKGAVLVEDAAARPDAGNLARARVRLSGSEDAVIALADAIEREAPLARFASWRIERTSGAVRLQGEVIAPWR